MTSLLLLSADSLILRALLLMWQRAIVLTPRLLTDRYRLPGLYGRRWGRLFLHRVLAVAAW